LIEFRPLTLGEVTEQDLEGVKKAVNAHVYPPNLERIKDFIANGAAHIWRFSLNGEWKGVVVVQLRKDAHNSDIFIWLVGGSEMRDNVEYMEEVIAEYGRYHGAKFIRSHVMDHILKDALIRGYKKEFTCIVKEI
jgi:hypothetical protein